MNNELAAFGGLLFLGAIIFGIVLSVLWTILPLYLFHKLGDLGYKLDKIEYQIRRLNSPPVETKPKPPVFPPPQTNIRVLVWSLIIAIIFVTAVGFLIGQDLKRKKAPKPVESIEAPENLFPHIPHRQLSF